MSNHSTSTKQLSIIPPIKAKKKKNSIGQRKHRFITPNRASSVPLPLGGHNPHDPHTTLQVLDLAPLKYFPVMFPSCFLDVGGTIISSHPTIRVKKFTMKHFRGPKSIGFYISMYTFNLSTSLPTNNLLLICQNLHIKT